MYVCIRLCVRVFMCVRDTETMVSVAGFPRPKFCLNGPIGMRGMRPVCFEEMAAVSTGNFGYGPGRREERGMRGGREKEREEWLSLQ